MSSPEILYALEKKRKEYQTMDEIKENYVVADAHPEREFCWQFQKWKGANVSLLGLKRITLKGIYVPLMAVCLFKRLQDVRDQFSIGSFSLSGNYHACLGKILQWFPAGFSMV